MDVRITDLEGTHPHKFKLEKHIKVWHYIHMSGGTPSFEWDEVKNLSNVAKHGVNFVVAQKAFLDPNRIIAENVRHSTNERRYFCIGAVMAKY